MSRYLSMRESTLIIVTGRLFFASARLLSRIIAGRGPCESGFAGTQTRSCIAAGEHDEISHGQVGREK